MAASPLADVPPALVVTAGVALACVPLVVALSPIALAAVWVASILARSVAPVHQHCHAHYKIFQQPVLDGAYDAVLMLAAGNVTAVWELQHVQGHHRAYLERHGDPANNQRFGGGRLRFTIFGDAMSFVDSLHLARTRRARLRLWRQQVVQLAVTIVLVIAAPGFAIAFLLVPWLLLRWAVFWFSYAQHADVPMTDVYTGSVTHFGLTNRLYLNVGHHTAHHEKPTLHWTRLPARTAQILERIPATCLR
ncbi:MAG: Fatty acid desaturase family protein [Myxococcales bacterium]|nr:Fatty acid desaturase family protein [Myxococcales bacterium]